jgi:hypothetical protein
VTNDRRDSNGFRWRVGWRLVGVLEQTYGRRLKWRLLVAGVENQNGSGKGGRVETT